MKITNIFKVGALLLAVGMFAGCAVEEDEVGVFDGDKVDFTADSGSGNYYRAMTISGTNRSNIIATVTIDSLTSDSTNGIHSGGTAGVIFDAEGSKEKGWNLGVVGFRVRDSKLEAYVSKFETVSFEDGYTNEVSLQKLGGGAATETEILKGTDNAPYATINGITAASASSKVSVMVSIKYESNAYTIQFYDPSKTTVTSVTNAITGTPLGITGTTGSGVTSSTTDGATTAIKISDESNGKSGKYVNINAGKRLNAEWKFDAGAGEAEEFVEE